jgi:O-antigen/teichoic acid export membrane protein
VFFFVLLNAGLFGILNGLRQMKKYAAASIFQSILLILFTLVFFYFYPNIISAIAGLVLSTMGTTLFLIFVSRKSLHIDLENFIKTTKMLLGFGIQTLGTNLVNMINLQADTFFIGFFLDAKEVGYYAAATGISRFFWVAPQAIQTISYPAISEYWAKRNIPGLELMVDRSMRYAALALIPLGMMMGLFSSEIITWIYGQEFFNSSLSLQILLVGTIFFGIFFTSIGGALAGANRPDLSLKAASLGAGLTIILNIILVPNFGIVGAAIATTSSLIFFACLYYVLTIRTMRLNLNLKWLTKMIIASLIGVSIYVLLRDVINQNLLRFCILSIFTGLSVVISFPREDIYLAKSLTRSFKIENIISNLQRRN